MFKKTIIPDILSGLTVSFAALSLGAAFGAMSGRGAIAGIIGAAIIPIITSVFGGTRIQASGPTAPMTAVSALVIAYAYDQFPDKVLAEQFVTLVFIMNAIFLIIAGLLRTGKFIQKVPQTVVLGFMNGIGVLIWVDQLKRLFGSGESAIQGNVYLNAGIALAVFGTIYFIPWFLKKINVPFSIRKFVPSIFITIILFTIITTALNLQIEHVNLGQKIESFSEFTAMITSFFPSDPSLFTSEILLLALPYALQLTLLAYLDSLLTSLVIDRMTKEKTKANKELVAQGLANGVSALLQGLQGAQATIRSVLLIKEGAQTRLAGVLTGVFVLTGFILFNSSISLITSAVFAGVLFKAGLDVLDRDFIICYFKYNWIRSRERNLQLFFILYATIITVLIDLNVAVITGTLFFYIAKALWKIKDAEEDFADVHAEELLGSAVEKSTPDENDKK
jgi:sulfate permease, SulP family